MSLCEFTGCDNDIIDHGPPSAGKRLRRYTLLNTYIDTADPHTTVVYVCLAAHNVYTHDIMLRLYEGRTRHIVLRRRRRDDNAA